MRLLPRLLATLVVLGSVTAEAQTGAVLRFRGPGGGAARNAAVRGAQQELEELVPRARVERTADRMGARLTSIGGRRRVARELSLDLIITGRVTGRGRSARTQINVYGPDGRRLARRRARRPIGQAGRRDVQRKTAAAIRAAIDEIGDFEDDEEEEEEEEEEAEEIEAPPPVEIEDDDDDDDAPSEGPIYIPTALVRLGVDGRTRDVSVRLVDGRRRNYEASLYPELSVSIETHPLHGSDTAALRGLYAQIDFNYALGLDTVERDPSNPSVETPVDTTAWRLFLQLGYLIPAAEERVQIGLLFGFGHDRFDLSSNNTLPSTRYNQFRIGLVGTLSAYGTLMQARLDAGYRFLFGAGDLGSAFGETATGGAFDIGLSIGGQADVGFAYGLRFGFTRYNLEFAGVGAEGEGEDGSDQAITIGLNLGWAIR